MNYIAEYYKAICENEIVVGNRIKQVYEIITKNIESGTYIYDENKSDNAIWFIENFCRHHEGALAPNLIKLELWQKALISCMFGILDHEGLRQFREVMVIIGRKNGKTLLAAAISACLVYMEREYGARVYFAATKLEQANLCYDAFYQMVDKDKYLRQFANKRRSDTYIKEWNSSIKPLSFASKTGDGLNISLGICDEIASWSGTSGLKFYEVLKSSLGARKQPMILSISTAGYVNDGIYDELMKRATAFLNGSSEETRLLPMIYQIDEMAKWDDIEELKKSNPNMGVSVSADFFKDEIAVAHNSMSKKTEFITKYCNMKQNSVASWLPYEIVDACCGDEFNLEEFRGCYCVGGIDLSQTTDLTSCCIVVEKSGTLYAISKFFMPGEKIEEAQERDHVPYKIFQSYGILKASGENYVDYNDCFNWFRSLVEDYEIYPLMVGYDRYSAQYLVQQMEGYGFHMDDVFQGNNLHPVIVEAEGMLRDRKLRLGTNNLLKSHFLNVAMKQDTENRKLRPVKIDQVVHIDGFVAVIDALTVRQKWWDSLSGQLMNE